MKNNETHLNYTKITKVISFMSRDYSSNRHAVSSSAYELWVLEEKTPDYEYLGYLFEKLAGHCLNKFSQTNVVFRKKSLKDLSECLNQDNTFFCLHFVLYNYLFSSWVQ